MIANNQSTRIVNTSYCYVLISNKNSSGIILWMEFLNLFIVTHPLVMFLHASTCHHSIAHTHNLLNITRLFHPPDEVFQINTLSTHNRCHYKLFDFRCKPFSSTVSKDSQFWCFLFNPLAFPSCFNSTIPFATKGPNQKLLKNMSESSAGEVQQMSVTINDSHNPSSFEYSFSSTISTQSMTMLTWQHMEWKIAKRVRMKWMKSPSWACIS